MNRVTFFGVSFSTQRRKDAKGAKKRFGNGRCRLGKAQRAQRDARKRWARRFAPLPNLLFEMYFSTQRREDAKTATFPEATRKKCAETKTFGEKDIAHETIQDNFLCALCVFAPLRWMSQTTIKSTTP